MDRSDRPKSPCSLALGCSLVAEHSWTCHPGPGFAWAVAQIVADPSVERTGDLAA